MIILKFWAFIYRLTGYYSNYATIKEYEHLQKSWNDIEGRMAKDFDFSLKGAVGLQIGLWQAHNGFYRRWRSLERELKNCNK